LEQIYHFTIIINLLTPSDDVMNPLLTVRENIMHSANMRLPTSVSLQEKERLVTSVINVLDLTKKENIIVGDIGGKSSLSGGQRKRVSVAIELVICPSILFLDEPTSGLDSKTALALLTVLKDVASLGINVIAVLHQPRYEILKKCNQIVVLAEGKVKYMGSPSLAELSPVFPRLRQSDDDENPLIGVNAADMLIDYIEEFTWVPKELEPMKVKTVNLFI
jgi:ABC-type multidrug transport system ATPase subunit